MVSSLPSDKFSYNHRKKKKKKKKNGCGPIKSQFGIKFSHRLTRISPNSVPNYFFILAVVTVIGRLLLFLSFTLPISLKRLLVLYTIFRLSFGIFNNFIISIWRFRSQIITIQNAIWWVIKNNKIRGKDLKPILVILELRFLINSTIIE